MKNKFRLSDIFLILIIILFSIGINKFFTKYVSILFLIFGVSFVILKNYINFWSPKVQEIVLIIFLIFLAYQFGKIIGQEKYWAFGIIGGVIYLAISFKRPEIIFLLSLILIINMFGLIKPDILSVKGIFKINDLLLIGGILPIILKSLVERENIKKLLEPITSKAIILFIFSIIIFIVITVIRYNYSLLSSFKVARHYFYYLFFFVTIYSITTKKQLEFVIKTMIALSILFAFMYIIQAISGGTIALFPITNPIFSRIWGVPLARIYITFGFATTFCYVLIAYLGSKKMEKKQKIIILGIAIILLAIFFSLGRVGWFSFFATVGTILLIIPNKERFCAGILKLAVFFIIFLSIVSIVRYSSYVLVTGGKQRVVSLFSDIGEKKISYRARARLLRMTWQIIKENPFLGAGFLYPETPQTKHFLMRTVFFSDCGLSTILNTMGISGLILHIILYIIFIERSWKIAKKLKNEVYKLTVIAFIGTYIGGWVALLAGESFTNHSIITIISATMGLTEAMSNIEIYEKE